MLSCSPLSITEAVLPTSEPNLFAFAADWMAAMRSTEDERSFLCQVGLLLDLGEQDVVVREGKVDRLAELRMLTLTGARGRLEEEASFSSEMSCLMAISATHTRGAGLFWEAAAVLLSSLEDPATVMVREAPVPEKRSGW